MRMSKVLRRDILILALIIVVLLPPVLGWTQTDNNEQDKPPASKISTGSDQEETQKLDQSKETSPVPPPGKGGKPLKEFKPTEKIAADSAVSFPIDI